MGLLAGLCFPVANGGIFIIMARLLSFQRVVLPVECTHVYAECRLRA